MPESLREKAKNYPHIVNRVLALSLIASLLALVALTTYFQTEQSQISQTATLAALSNESIAQSNALNMSRLQASEARFLMDKGESALALALLLEAAKIDNPPPEVAELLRENVLNPGIRHIYDLPMIDPNSARGFRDMSMPNSDVSSDGTFALYSRDSTLVQVDLKTGAVMREIAVDGKFPNVSPFITPDNRQVIVSGSTCAVIDLTTGEPLPALSEQMCIPIFAPDGHTVYLIAWTDKGQACHLYDMTTWQATHTVDCGSGLFSPDSRVLVTLTGDAGSPAGSEIKLWDVATGNVLVSLNTPQRLTTMLGFRSWSYPADSEMPYGSIDFVNTEANIAPYSIGDTHVFAYNTLDVRLSYPHGFIPADGGMVLLDNGDMLDVFRPSDYQVTQVHVADSYYSKPAYLLAHNDHTVWLGSAVYGLIEVDITTPPVAEAGTPTPVARESLAELIEYARSNRYIPVLTCVQREQYQVLPLCLAMTPTPTPFMSPTPPA